MAAAQAKETPGPESLMDLLRAVMPLAVADAHAEFQAQSRRGPVPSIALSHGDMVAQAWAPQLVALAAHHFAHRNGPTPLNRLPSLLRC